MTDQQMPARIWADELLVWGTKGEPEDTAYVRSDIAERMAEALGAWLEYAEDNLSEFDLEECFAGEDTALCPKCQSNGCLNQKIRAARSALSAFRSATQDTEARHD